MPPNVLSNEDENKRKLVASVYKSLPNTIRATTLTCLFIVRQVCNRTVRVYIFYKPLLMHRYQLVVS